MGHEMHTADLARRFWVSLALTVLVVAISPMPLSLLGLPYLSIPGNTIVLVVLATVIYLYGGAPFLRGFVEDVRSGRPGMMTLVAVGITAAYGYSLAIALGLPGEPLYWELATLVDVMLLGHWIEMRSTMSAYRALDALARLVPSKAHRVTESGDVDADTDTLVVGDVVRVLPGERVPADGLVIEGESTVDESMLTGESVPVRRGADERVVGGSVNGRGALVVRVERVGEQTFLAEVAKLVSTAQQSKSQTQYLADRAAAWLTVVALVAGGLTLTAWWIASTASIAFVLERAVTVVVIACPHALGLAIPLVVVVSTGLAARRGLLVRDRDAFERSRNIDTVVFDKTGTLTEGRFAVKRVVVTGVERESELLRLAGSVEVNSSHPIASAIVDAAGPDVAAAKDFENLPGSGVKGVVDDRVVEVLSLASVQQREIDVPASVAELSAAASTVAVVTADGSVIGAVTVEDLVRPQAKEAVARLKIRGIRPILLTGDARPVAEKVARELGIDEVLAEVPPSGKAAAIEGLRMEGRSVAMVGDGVNDAPALAAADLGVAIGAGTDVAIESADVVLVRNDPRDVALLLEFARRSYRKMLQNLTWATGYNVVAIPLAAGVLAWRGVLLSPAAGAALMAASTVIVAINARLLTMPSSD